jgi:hypothetical protein
VARAAAARRGGAGRGPARGGSGGRGAGAARGAEKSGAGQLGSRKTAGEGGGVGRRENKERRELEVEDKD